MAREWSTPEEQERAEFMGRLLLHMAKRSVETVHEFKQVAAKDLNRIKRAFANPFGPYDKVDFLSGAALVGSTYVAQAAMILWGPPPVKALGAAWVAVPMGDPFVFHFGVQHNPF